MVLGSHEVIDALVIYGWKVKNLSVDLSLI